MLNANYIFFSITVFVFWISTSDQTHVCFMFSMLIFPHVPLLFQSQIAEENLCWKQFDAQRRRRSRSKESHDSDREERDFNRRLKRYLETREDDAWGHGGFSEQQCKRRRLDEVEEEAEEERWVDSHELKPSR